MLKTTDLPKLMTNWHAYLEQKHLQEDCEIPANNFHGQSNYQFHQIMTQSWRSMTFTNGNITNQNVCVTHAVLAISPCLLSAPCSQVQILNVPSPCDFEIPPFPCVSHQRRNRWTATHDLAFFRLLWSARPSHIWKQSHWMTTCKMQR